jgi:methyltransferase (TIGR00027 family)
MKEGRPSLTANLVAGVRALHDAMPERERLFDDGVAAELVPGWLAVPALVARRAPFAAKLMRTAARIVSADLSEHVVLRTRAIDDALRSALGDGATDPRSRSADKDVRQLVILGAGLDSRAERMPELATVPVFEVDYPASHAFKIARLGDRAAASRVKRVAIDFERDRLGDVLGAAGFEAATPAFFIWEGVTVYLGVETIAETIAALGALAAPRSRVAVTYSPRTGSSMPRWAEPIGKALGSAIGESLRGFVSPDVIHTFFERSGFEIVSDEDASVWSARYRPLEAPPRAWERLAVAERLARR